MLAAVVLEALVWQGLSREHISQQELQVLQLDSGDGCTTLRIYLKTIYTFKR